MTDPDEPDLLERIAAVLADLPRQSPRTEHHVPHAWGRCTRCGRVVFVFRDGTQHCALCDPPLPPAQPRHRAPMATGERARAPAEGEEGRPRGLPLRDA